ncbi:hypothetical protein JV16_01641 [Anoxybacillus ayderensis]|uniref:Uncharacterized protein n=1 Tax=Anoxybacillus ayderensis TaxID=265546 RepID=A0A0D0HPC5_9BACL|nr:hypothetical protein JV16_01641 [Anoxybacillus ayderensis]
MTKDLAQQLLQMKGVYLTSEGRKILEAIANEKAPVTSTK